MNPLEYYFQDREKLSKPKQESLALYFISNGWVRLDSSWKPPWNSNWNSSERGKILRADGSTLEVKLFNIDVSLNSVVQEWRKSHPVVGLLNKIKNKKFLNNLAGAGMIPTSYFKAEALKVAETSESYRAMIESLLPMKQ
jgi:hypothetical protein